MSDLSLVSLEEIWQELCKRNDGVILATQADRDNKTTDIQVSYYGGKPLCIGLAEHTKDKLLEALREEVRGE